MTVKRKQTVYGNILRYGGIVHTPTDNNHCQESTIIDSDVNTIMDAQIHFDFKLLPTRHCYCDWGNRVGTVFA